MDQNVNEKALEMYDILCEAMKVQEWNYDGDKEKLTIQFGVNGDDLPMHFIVRIDAERMLIRLMSPMPYKMSEEHRIDGALATCHANYRINDGSFDYDVTDGEIVFRMTSSYRASLISVDLFLYMINIASYTVDEFNDKFLLIDKGALTLEDFINGKKE